MVRARRGPDNIITERCMGSKILRCHERLSSLYFLVEAGQGRGDYAGAGAEGVTCAPADAPPRRRVAQVVAYGGGRRSRRDGGSGEPDVLHIMARDLRQGLTLALLFGEWERGVACHSVQKPVKEQPSIHTLAISANMMDSRPHGVARREPELYWLHRP